MNKNYGMILVVLATILMSIGIVHAESTNNQGNALDVRYAHLDCAVTFTNAQIDSVTKYLPNIDLNGNKTQLTTELAQAKTYSDSGDKKKFDSYVSGTLLKDLKMTSSNLNDVKKNIKTYNLTNDTFSSFKNDLKTEKQSYASCVDTGSIAMANAFLNNMNKSIANWQKIIDSMSQKNISVTDMQTVLTQMQTEVQQIQQDIVSGNATQIKESLEDYRQANLHFWARFEIARLRAYTSKIGPLANKYDSTGKIDDIDNKLGDASNKASEGKKYGQGDFEQTWNNIRDATKELKDSAKDINTARMEGRKANMDNRSNMMGNKTNKGNRSNMMGNRTGFGRNNRTGSDGSDDNGSNGG